MMYPDVHFLEEKLVTVGEVRLPRRTLNVTKAHLLLSEQIPQRRSAFHYVKTLGRPSIPQQTCRLDHKLIASGDRYRLGVLNLQE
jgi:hypothetical protein